MPNTNPPANGFDKRPQDINLSGRPKREWTMAGLIEEALEDIEPSSGKEFKKLVAKRLAHMAVNGDIQAIKEINDRIDGKPKQNVDMTTNGKDLPVPLLAGIIDVQTNDSTNEAK